MAWNPWAGGERLMFVFITWVMILTTVQGQEASYILFGACSDWTILNGKTFEFQGNTKNGAPYFRTTEENYYMYYDANCRLGADESERWIIDNDPPSLTAVQDLDNDKECHYQAHVNSQDPTRPPASAMWKMLCQGDWKDQKIYLSFSDQSMAVPTTTIRTTTMPPSTEDSAYVLHLSGACDYLNFLNGAMFLKQGTTASGAPYFKALMGSARYYIYWDPSCYGGSAGSARWIIDNDAPDVNRVHDLDKDGECLYQGRVDWEDKKHPPYEATWTLFCNHVPVHYVLTLEPSTTTSTSTIKGTPTTETSTTTTTKTVAPIIVVTTTKITASTMTVAATATTKTATTTMGEVYQADTTAAPTTTTAITTTPANGNSMLDTLTTTEADEADGDTATSNTSAPISEEGNLTEDVTTETTGTTTAPPTSTHEASNAADLLVISGACPEQGYLNGMTFKKMGATSSSAFFYESAAQDRYIYYDPDCTGVAVGNGTVPARWIIDKDKPNLTRNSDLDNDGSCTYLARVDTPVLTSLEPPPETTWTMYCNGSFSWVELTLKQPEVGAATATFTPRTTTRNAAPVQTTTAAPTHSLRPGGEPVNLKLSGACPYMEYLNRLTFKKNGTTASGAPFYKAVGEDYYLHFDPEPCPVFPNAAWIIDNDRPSTSKTSDLDQDGDCVYLARLDTPHKASPPSTSDWWMYCGEKWQDGQLKFEESYLQLSQGSCTAVGMFPVVFGESCSAAAAFVGLPTTSVYVSTAVSRPEGCQWESTALQDRRLVLASNPRNKGNGQMGNQMPLCSIREDTGVHSAITSGVAGSQCFSAALLLAAAIALH